MEEENIWIWDR